VSSYTGTAIAVEFPNPLSSGDLLTLTIGDVINPSVASSTDKISFEDSPFTDVAPVPPADVTYPNGALINFAGTTYVFAGGHGFPIPQRKMLANIQAVDHAKVLTAASGATAPAAKPAVGTTIALRHHIFVVGSDGKLHGFATELQLKSDGYDPAYVVTVPNLGGLTVGATAGTLGAEANALATQADGAIVDASGQFYVFAGGKAFGIPTSTAVATIEARDPGTPLMSSRTISTRATDPVRTGTLVTLGGVVYVSEHDSLFDFKSEPQLAADGYGGTPTVVIPNSGGLGLVADYSGH
jgi:hypothetical protein